MRTQELRKGEQSTGEGIEGKRRKGGQEETDLAYIHQSHSKTGLNQKEHL